MATFTTDRPQVLDWVRVVTGLKGDDRLIGIDFRVRDGLMYGVGNQGGIYTIKTPPDTVDRLRVISDNGQNLRHNLNDHTTVEDAVLTTPPNPAPTKGVTAAAYTNNDLNPDTATTLFDLATMTDQVLIQSPANNGTLAPTGALGVDAGANAGADIFSDLTNGKTTSVSAFATIVPPSGSPATFYSINLFTGAATAVGQVPLAITDVAVALDRS